MLETLYKKVGKFENFIDKLEIFDGLYRKYSISGILLLFFGWMILGYLEEGFSSGWWDLFVMISLTSLVTFSSIIIFLLPIFLFFFIYYKVFIPLCKVIQRLRIIYSVDYWENYLGIENEGIIRLLLVGFPIILILNLIYLDIFFVFNVVFSFIFYGLIMKLIIWTYDGFQIEKIGKDNYSRITKKNILKISFYPSGQLKYEQYVPNGYYRKYYKTGQKENEVTYKDGEKEGTETYWYENGQKLGETEYKNDGEKTISYYKTGEKESERFLDKKFRDHGKHTYFYKNGNILTEDNYKNGRLNGLSTYWYENDQKKYEITYKDGEKEGTETYWYENGQKKYEITYKDRKLSSLKNWKEDGSVQ